MQGFTVQSLPKFEMNQLEAIMETAAFSDSALSLISSPVDPVKLINDFLAADLFVDAIVLLSMGLPTRESIWWAYLCLSDNDIESDISEHNKKDLDLVKQWVFDPSENLRLVIAKLVDQNNLQQPIDWLKVAVFWSGDNIAPPGKLEIQPQPLMPNEGAQNAIKLHLYQQEDLADSAKTSLLKGFHIANGGNGMIQAQKEAS